MLSVLRCAKKNPNIGDGAAATETRCFWLIFAGVVRQATLSQYAQLTVTIPEELREETDRCAHCGVRLYLEGESSAALSATMAPEVQSGGSGSGRKRGNTEVDDDCAEVQDSQAVQPTTGLELLKAVKKVQALKVDGIINSAEAKRLQTKILAEHNELNSSMRGFSLQQKNMVHACEMKIVCAQPSREGRLGSEKVSREGCPCSHPQ